MIDFDIIFDNTSGITLETEDYCHYFNSGVEAAKVVSDLIDGAEPQDCAANEPDSRIGIDAELERDPRYHWITGTGITDAIWLFAKEGRVEFLESISSPLERSLYVKLFELRDNIPVYSQ